MKTISLPDFSQASILVIGDIMLDRYWFGDTGRISPEAPVPVVQVKQIDERPGGAGNVALNLAALGAKVMLMGVTGKDEAAKTLCNQLAVSGIQANIQQLEDTPTITKLRIISRHQQLIRLDFEEKFLTFDPALLLEAFKQALSNIQLIILSDYQKGTLACAQQFIQLAKAANIPVLVDPKGHDFTLYQGADIITPNLKEFEAVVGHCNHEQDIIDKAQVFLDEHNIAALLLTRGEHGMTLFRRGGNKELHLPAHAKEVFDVTGAGDTVIATLGASLAAGSTLPEAMQLANFAASLVVAKLGAASNTTPELEAALNKQDLTFGGILNDQQLLHAVNHVRAQGKRVVFTNGCFDILHAGHVHYLQQAKQLGDYLIVAVNEDSSIKRLKGPGRPINQVEHRMTVLASLGVVDWVVPFGDDTPERLLKMLQPQVLVKGGDYTINQVVGADIVYAYGGEVHVLGVTQDVSTTNIIKRMVKSVNTDAAPSEGAI